MRAASTSAIGRETGEQKVKRSTERRRLPRNFFRSGCRKKACGLRDHAPHGRRDRKFAVIGEGRKAQPAYVDGARIAQLHAGKDEWIARAIEHAQAEDQILHVPGHWAHLADDSRLSGWQAVRAAVGRAALL